MTVITSCMQHLRGSKYTEDIRGVIISPYSSLAVRPADELSRLLDAHLAQLKFLELFAKFSVIGGQRTYSYHREEGGSYAIQ